MLESGGELKLKDLPGLAFRDKDWFDKLLKACGLLLGSMIVPILPVSVYMGYMAEVMRKVMRNALEPPLPDWGTIGEKLGEGFKLIVLVTILHLPSALLWMLGSLLIASSNIVSFPLYSFQSEGLDTILGGVLLFWLAGSVLLILGGILVLAAGMLMGPGICAIVDTGRFRAGFEIRQWGKIVRRNIGGFLVVFAFSMAMTFIIMMASQFLGFFCFLLILALCLPALTCIHLFTFMGYGHAYRRGLKLSSQPEELG